MFVTISPWNFPLAIFTGQLAAALAAGNSVIAKPAEATSLTAAAVVDLLHQAGVPADALILLPGEGGTIGPTLVSDPRIAGVAFTGGTETAWAIARAMAAGDTAIRPFIAETGGLNAMIVDSSALPEQVVTDTVESRSAGQRCSALRVLFLQEDVAPKIVEMLQGAMAELRIGDPGQLATDVGPVIDEPAREDLLRHIASMSQAGRLLYQCPLDEHHSSGSFVPPTLIEIDRIGRLIREPFGPVLHLVRFPASRLDQGGRQHQRHRLRPHLRHPFAHRRDHRARGAPHPRRQHLRQPQHHRCRGRLPAFGGEALSGTGFKAGGPSYLLRFCTERTVTVNTAAMGGNLALLGALQDRPGSA